MIDFILLIISLYLLSIIIVIILSLLIGLKYFFLRTEFDRLVDRDVLFIVLCITIYLIYIAYKFLMDLVRIFLS